MVAEVSATNGPEPPGKLGTVGKSLWRDVTNAYEFSNRGSYQVLLEACAASDRAASLRAAIDRDGEVIRSRGAIRDHPALKHELANRAFVVRSLMRLGLDLEPVRGAPGRPAGALSEMPTKRRKIPPKRISGPVPAWVARVKAGERPELDSEPYTAMIGWHYFGEFVPGLPEPGSPEGRALWRTCITD